MKRAISLKGVLVFNFIIVILITILFSGMNLFYKNKLGKRRRKSTTTADRLKT